MNKTFERLETREDLIKIMNKNKYELGVIYPNKPITLTFYSGISVGAEMIDFYNQLSTQVLVRIDKANYRSIRMDRIVNMTFVDRGL